MLDLYAPGFLPAPGFPVPFDGEDDGDSDGVDTGTETGAFGTIGLMPIVVERYVMSGCNDVARS